MKLTKQNCYKKENIVIEKTTGTFKPKAIIVVIDELTEIMETNDYKSQSAISDSISSIARLGRAAGCHLCLATQRPSGNVISSDLKNNIGMSTLLGDFGSSESTLVFDDDVSDLAKPEIKGRGFIKNGQNIIEYQSFWVDDFKFKRKEVSLNKSGSVVVDKPKNIEEKEIDEFKETNVENSSENDVEEIQKENDDFFEDNIDDFFEPDDKKFIEDEKRNINYKEENNTEINIKKKESNEDLPKINIKTKESNSLKINVKINN